MEGQTSSIANPSTTITNFYENLEILKNNRNISTKDLEKQLNFSDGYFDKLNKGKNFPNIDSIIRISHFFNIGIEPLLQMNLKCIPDSELKIFNFIKKLEIETLEGKLKWKKWKSAMYKTAIEIADSKKEYGVKAYLTGHPYILNIQENIYIKIIPFITDEKQPQNQFYKIVMRNDLDSKSEKIIADQMKSCDSVKNAINNLWNSIMCSIKYEYVSDDVIIFIDDYLKKSDKKNIGILPTKEESKENKKSK